MESIDTGICNFKNCQNTIYKNNQTGRCRDHRRVKDIQTCFYPQCDELIRVDNLSGLCTQHRIAKKARDSHVNSSNSSFQYETESAEPRSSLLSIEPYSIIPTMPAMTFTAMSSDSLVLRDSDQAITNAFDQAEETPEHKKQAIKLMHAMGLEPVAVIDSENVESNLLGKPSVISALQMKQKRGLTLSLMASPKKFKPDDTSSLPCLAMPIDLDVVLRNSFARQTLANNKYMEMTDDIVKLLNQDWFFRPQMRFFAAKALSGAILVDPVSCSAILINSIEVYGRSSLVDAHHERCLNKREIPALSTNPPLNCRYKRIWAISVKDSDGTKLNVATKTFNALVTSSIRLDARHKPELGPTTSKFVIDKEHGQHAQIFLDVDNYADATNLALDEHAISISDTDILQQLRQIRSKFDEHSSYVPSRSSNSLCDFHRLQPQTVFTYCTFDSSAPKCDGKLASRVFAHVAGEVIKKKAGAMLDKSIITNIIRQCKPNGRIINAVQSIHALFPEESTSIEILNNPNLCKCLKELAQILHSYISSANETIVTEIETLF